MLNPIDLHETGTRISGGQMNSGTILKRGIHIFNGGVKLNYHCENNTIKYNANQLPFGLKILRKL